MTKPDKKEGGKPLSEDESKVHKAESKEKKDNNDNTHLHHKTGRACNHFTCIGAMGIAACMQNKNSSPLIHTLTHTH